MNYLPYSEGDSQTIADISSGLYSYKIYIYYPTWIFSYLTAIVYNKASLYFMNSFIICSHNITKYKYANAEQNLLSEQKKFLTE